MWKNLSVVRNMISISAGLTIIVHLVGCGGSSSSVAPTTKTVVVSDGGYARVLLYSLPTSTGEAATVVLGQPDFTTTTQTTTATGMGFPEDAETDSSGNLWVSDEGNCRLLEFKPPFTIGMAASLVIGQADFTSRICNNTTASNLKFPADLTFDSKGNLWVADGSNNRVLAFQPPFTTGMSATLVIGQADFTHNGCAATASSLCNPWGIAFDSHGNLFLGDDSNCRVLEYQPPFTTGMSASLVLGQTALTTNTCATTQNGLADALGIRFDSTGNLWVADGSNCRVVEYQPPFSNGMNATVAIGEPDFTSKNCVTTATSLIFPAGEGFDTSGNLYVADHGNSRTVIYPPPFTTGMAATVALGQPDLTTHGASNTATGEGSPENVSTIP